MFCLSSRKLAAMFLPKTETAIPVFVPDPEASYQAYMMKQLPEGLWTTSICECYEDLSNCFFTCLCPCITMGQNSEIVNRGEISCTWASLLHVATGVVLFGWIFGSTNRTSLRQHFSLPESPLPDWSTHLLYMRCALCQEHRELRTRGADPSLGWEGNVTKWKEEAMTPPIVVHRMACLYRTQK
ncbi:PLAC8 family protein, putative [Theobroma cacao]|uniref:PLAC8 family protein, putative n=1 Tax=Theobroma cacao TaxID=3641 RepID=A0A061EAU4_THECC|nr:PLAC8 family protein, putative [Theobroma cacao]